MSKKQLLTARAKGLIFKHMSFIAVLAYINRRST